MTVQTTCRPADLTLSWLLNSPPVRFMGENLWLSQAVETQAPWLLNNRGFQVNGHPEMLRGEKTCLPQTNNTYSRMKALYQMPESINLQPSTNSPSLNPARKRTKNDEHLPAKKYMKTTGSINIVTGANLSPSSHCDPQSESSNQSSNLNRTVNKQPAVHRAGISDHILQGFLVSQLIQTKRLKNFQCNNGVQVADNACLPNAHETASVTPPPEWIEDRELGNSIYVSMKLVPPFEEFKLSPACGDFNIRLSLKDRLMKQNRRRIRRKPFVTVFPVPIMKGETIIPDLVQPSSEIIDLCDETNIDEEPNAVISTPLERSPTPVIRHEDISPNKLPADVAKINNLSEQDQFIMAVFKTVNQTKNAESKETIDTSSSTQSTVDLTEKESDSIQDQELEVTSSLPSSLETRAEHSSLSSADQNEGSQSISLMSAIQLVTAGEENKATKIAETDTLMTLYSPKGGVVVICDKPISQPIIENSKNVKHSSAVKRKHESTSGNLKTDLKKSSFMSSKYDYLFSKEKYEEKLTLDKKLISECYNKCNDSNTKKHKDKNKTNMVQSSLSKDHTVTIRDDMNNVHKLSRNSDTEKSSCVAIRSNDVVNERLNVDTGISELCECQEGTLKHSKELDNIRRPSDDPQCITQCPKDQIKTTESSKDFNDITESSEDKVTTQSSKCPNGTAELTPKDQEGLPLSFGKNENFTGEKSIVEERSTMQVDAESDFDAVVQVWASRRINSEISVEKQEGKNQVARRAEKIDYKMLDKPRRKSLDDSKKEFSTTENSTSMFSSMKRSVSCDAEFASIRKKSIIDCERAEMNHAKPASQDQKNSNCFERCEDTSSNSLNIVTETPAPINNLGVLGDKNNNEQKTVEQSSSKVPKLVEIDMFSCTENPISDSTSILHGKSLRERNVVTTNTLRKKRKYNLKYYTKLYRLRSCSVRLERNPEIDLLSLHSFESLPTVKNQVVTILHLSPDRRVHLDPSTVSLSPQTFHRKKPPTGDPPKDVLDQITKRIILNESKAIECEANPPELVGTISSVLDPPLNQMTLADILAPDEKLLKPCRKISYSEALIRKKRVLQAENQTVPAANTGDCCTDIPPHVDPRLKQTTYCGMPPVIMQIDLTVHDENTLEIIDSQKSVAASAVHKYLRSEASINLPPFIEYVCPLCNLKYFDHTSWRRHCKICLFPISEGSMPVSISSATDSNSSVGIPNIPVPNSNSSAGVPNIPVPNSNSSVEIPNIPVPNSNSSVPFSCTSAEIPNNSVVPTSFSSVSNSNSSVTSSYITSSLISISSSSTLKPDVMIPRSLMLMKNSRQKDSSNENSFKN